MKSIISILVVLVGLNNVNLLAQDVEVLPVSDEVVEMELIAGSDERLVYRVKDVMTDLYTSDFKVVDKKTGETKKVVVEKVEYEGKTGLVSSYFVREGIIYELHRFSKKGALLYCNVGIVKRNISDLKQVGDVILIGDFYAGGRNARPSIDLYKGENGFYLISKSYQKEFISRYSFDFEKIWEKDLSFLGEEGVKLNTISHTENDELLLGISITEAPKADFSLFKKEKLNNSGLLLIHIKEDGDAVSISPEFRDNMIVKKYEFKYYPEEKKLAAVFSVVRLVDKDKNETSGIGFAHMIWDLDGGLLSSNIDYLTYSDIESPDLDKHIELSKFKKELLHNDKGLPSIANNDNNFHVFFDEDGGAVVLISTFIMLKDGFSDVHSETQYSKLLYRISSKGEHKWTKFFPYYLTGHNLRKIAFTKDNKLHLFTCEYAENFSNNQFSRVTVKGRASWDNLIIAERIIDVKSGEIESFNPVLDKPMEGMLFRDMINLNKLNQELILTYHNSRRNKMQHVIVRY